MDDVLDETLAESSCIENLQARCGPRGWVQHAFELCLSQRILWSSLEIFRNVFLNGSQGQ